MTGKQWRDALAQIGVTHIELAAALRRDDRMLRRWMTGAHRTPREVETLLRLLCTGKIGLDDLR